MDRGLSGSHQTERRSGLGLRHEGLALAQETPKKPIHFLARPSCRVGIVVGSAAANAREAVLGGS